MFKSDLDGLYHREQIRDYIREANSSQRATSTPRRARRKVVLGFGVAAGTLALLWSLANLGQIATLLYVIK